MSTVILNQLKMDFRRQTYKQFEKNSN